MSAKGGAKRVKVRNGKTSGQKRSPVSAGHKEQGNLEKARQATQSAPASPATTAGLALHAPSRSATSSAAVTPSSYRGTPAGPSPPSPTTIHRTLTTTVVHAHASAVHTPSTHTNGMQPSVEFPALRVTMPPLVPGSEGPFAPEAHTPGPPCVTPHAPGAGSVRSRSHRSVSSVRSHKFLASLPVQHVTLQLVSPGVRATLQPPPPPPLDDSVIVDLSLDSPLAAASPLSTPPPPPPSPPPPRHLSLSLVCDMDVQPSPPRPEVIGDPQHYPVMVGLDGEPWVETVGERVPTPGSTGGAPVFEFPPEAPHSSPLAHTDDTLTARMQIAMSLALHHTLPKADLPLSVDITPELFQSYVKMRFPEEGSRATGTPAHHCGWKFKAKTYAPWVFARLRLCYHVGTADYTHAMTQPWHPFHADSKSGQYFFRSTDGRFIVKTQSKEESKLMRKLLIEYFHHMEQYPLSYINRVFGLHRLKVRGRYTHFFVMNNIFNSPLKMTRTYDLKGSWLGRLAKVNKKTGKKGICKEQDFETNGEMLRLGPARKFFFMQQLQADAKFLERQGVMDYSLLLGVHTITSPTEPNVPTLHSKGEHRGAVERKEEDDVARGLPRPSHAEVEAGTFGDPPYSDDVGVRGQLPDGTPSQEVYFFGIIDILQEYNFRKAGEAFLKSLIHDKAAVSAADPHTYAHRFVDYIDKHTM